MAYAGTTSTSPNLPRLVGDILTGPRQWSYNSTHTSSDISFADFIADGVGLGMRLGDGLIHTGSTTFLRTYHTITALGSTGGVTFSTGSSL